MERATFSISEAAERLGIGKSLAYKLARDHTLPGVLYFGPKRMLVSRAQLERYLAGESQGIVVVEQGTDQDFKDGQDSE